MTETTKKQKKTYTSKKTAKPSKQLTLGEFRAWLSGVEEMQADDWYPDPQQWKTIRAKIEEVIDNPNSRTSNARYVEDAPREIRPAGPSMLTGMDPRMSMAPGMANPNMPQITNTDTMAGGPVDRNTPIARIKTPNIDSSRGYNPAFE